MNSTITANHYSVILREMVTAIRYYKKSVVFEIEFNGLSESMGEAVVVCYHSFAHEYKYYQGTRRVMGSFFYSYNKDGIAFEIMKSLTTDARRVAAL